MRWEIERTSELSPWAWVIFPSSLTRFWGAGMCGFLVPILLQELGLHIPNLDLVLLGFLSLLQVSTLFVSNFWVPVSAKSLKSCLTLCDQGSQRLLCPWDSPGKNAGVGCHGFLQPSSQLSCVSCIGRQILFFLTTSAPWEAPVANFWIVAGDPLLFLPSSLV